MRKVSLFLCVGLLLGAVPAFAQMRGNAGQMMEKADANKDGIVTREEFQNMRLEMFDKLDRNKDGFLSQDDAPKRRLRAGGGGERLEEMKQELDKDGDGRISREEFANGPMLAFEKADTNRDGKLDSAEIEAFKKLVEEAKAARK
jgi:Ca2+-binding EF-hand superfamily protein